MFEIETKFPSRIGCVGRRQPTENIYFCTKFLNYTIIKMHIQGCRQPRIHVSPTRRWICTWMDILQWICRTLGLMGVQESSYIHTSTTLMIAPGLSVSKRFWYVANKVISVNIEPKIDRWNIQRVPLFFWSNIHAESRTKSIQPTIQPKLMKWQHMGFFCGKKSVLDQNQKNPDKKFQSWNSKPFKVHELSNLDPRTTPHMQGQSNRAMNPSPEACCMIEGWGPKHLWKRACRVLGIPTISFQ